MNHIEKAAGFIQANLMESIVQMNEDMKKHTSFQTGGNADLFIEPGNIEELQILIRYLREENIPYLIIGQGSNTIVSDLGIREAVIKIGGKFNKCTVDKETVTAEAGAPLEAVCQEAQKNCLTGMEFASGIPGSIGGAVFMNAGAYGGEMKDILEEVLVLTKDGEYATYKAQDLELGYRTSIMQKNGDLILSATFRLEKGNSADIQNKMDELKSRREQAQPLEYPSAGSVFKRPEGHFTGKLIQDAGLKGCQIGGAQVSMKHAGFIINTGGASTTDILSLIRHIQREVKTRFGVDLKPEVRLIGDFNLQKK
jgi:UDP-N-acetylmuramate dehydrogenase